MYNERVSKINPFDQVENKDFVPKKETLYLFLTGELHLPLCNFTSQVVYFTPELYNFPCGS